MLRQATTEGIGHRMQFLVCQGGELFFYDGFEGGHGPCPHLLLPHLHTAAVGRAGQQRPVEVSVTHSLSLFPCKYTNKMGNGHKRKRIFALPVARFIRNDPFRHRHADVHESLQEHRATSAARPRAPEARTNAILRHRPARPAPAAGRLRPPRQS